MLITGKLVQLRPVELNDLDRYYGWMNDREVTLHMGARHPISRLAEEEYLKEATKKTTPPEIALAIETLDGRHIGSVGLHRIRLEDRRAELGIMIGDKAYWSRGYGTDTICTVLRFAFDMVNLNRVFLRVYSENARGIACYHKCGFAEEARLRQSRWQSGRYIDTLVMGILASEFRTLEATKEEGSGDPGVETPGIARQL